MKKLFVGALLLNTVTLAMAQAWPTAKPIRIVVAYPAGGVSDAEYARALAVSCRGASIWLSLHSENRSKS